MTATTSGANADVPRRGVARGRVMRRYLPPQHGAWGILLLPFGIGVACSHPSWLHLPLLLAWLGGYLLSYYALLAVKTHRPDRVAGQLWLYGLITVPAAAVVLWRRPELLWFAPAFAVLLAVNALAARRHADRALVGGVVSVVQACLMIPIAAMVAGPPAPDVVRPAVVVLAYLTGSLLFVKTVIRHRGDRRYLIASVTFHVVALVTAGLLAWPLVLPFGWALVRAIWWARRATTPRALTPKQVGLAELVINLALLVMVPVLMR